MKRFDPFWRIVIALLLIFALAPVVALSGAVIADPDPAETTITPISDYVKVQLTEITGTAIGNATNNVTMVKVLTFALSAVFAGAAGVIWATRLTYIDPYVAFSVLYSFLPVLMAIFGGMGQIYGPVVGAVIFSYLQETLQTRFPEIYMLIFGFVLIATVLFMREGLVGMVEWVVRKLRRGGSAVQNADT